MLPNRYLLFHLRNGVCQCPQGRCALDISVDMLFISCSIRLLCRAIGVVVFCIRGVDGCGVCFHVHGSIVGVMFRHMLGAAFKCYHNADI